MAKEPVKLDLPFRVVTSQGVALVSDGAMAHKVVALLGADAFQRIDRLGNVTHEWDFGAAEWKKAD